MKTIAIALAAALAACGTSDPGGPGACGPNGPTNEGACANAAFIDCNGDAATSGIAALWTGSSCLVCTPAGQASYQATCTAGCAVHISMPYAKVDQVIAKPAILCAETPEAVAGDPCANANSDCLPTRAKIAADGTVSGQDYLRCNVDQCVAAAPPVIANYLGRCSDAALASESKPGVYGVAYRGDEICLLAWDASAGAVTSGDTIECAGDWQCPAGSLCDDQIPSDVVGASTFGVCKPGPKGTLTPAMLSR